MRIRVLAIVILGLVAAGCASHRAPVALAPGWSGPCSEPAWARQAAKLNAGSIDALPWSPWGKPETGWRIYAPQTARIVGATRCPYGSPGFAAALAGWKAQRRLPEDGAMDDKTYTALKIAWQAERPYVAVRGKGVCPDAPDETSLESIVPAESHYGRAILLRPHALAAYRRMIAAARREAPEIFTDAKTLTVFSGFRSPAYDASRCATEGNCDGVARAQCSAHRTGLAMDLVLGSASGFNVDSTANANRLWQSQTLAYQWMVANAARFGFVNYVYEPWHWEWTGEAP